MRTENTIGDTGLAMPRVSCEMVDQAAPVPDAGATLTKGMQHRCAGVPAETPDRPLVGRSDVSAGTPDRPLVGHSDVSAETRRCGHRAPTDLVHVSRPYNQ